MMLRWIILSILSSLFLSCRDPILEPAMLHIPDMKGFCYTSFASDGFTQGGNNNAIGDLKMQINNNWISLNVFEYQSTANTHDIAPNTTGVNPLTGNVWSPSSTVNDIKEGIREARLQQMRILLVPHVDLYSGEWRAAIRPDAQGQWFQSYTAMMLRYAHLAQEMQVEMLCVGVEYVVATQPAYTLQWKNLIATMRSMYSGRLVYGANWGGAFAYGITQPEFTQIEFWDALDDIGIDAYFPVTSSLSDTLPALDAAVSKMINTTSSIRYLHYRTAKPVLITEIGIQSVKGALSRPWDFTLGSAPTAEVDTVVQEFYYRVMIKALGEQPWCNGVFWWNWESIPTQFEAKNYTPRNKTSASFLKSWYTSLTPL